MAFSLMTLSIMTLSIITLILMALSIMALSIMILRIMKQHYDTGIVSLGNMKLRIIQSIIKLSKMTPSIMILIVTLRLDKTQHNDTLHMH
jgi:hypothetical protein